MSVEKFGECLLLLLGLYCLVAVPMEVEEGRGQSVVAVAIAAVVSIMG